MKNFKLFKEESQQDPRKSDSIEKDAKSSREKGYKDDHWSGIRKL